MKLPLAIAAVALLSVGAWTTVIPASAAGARGTDISAPTPASVDTAALAILAGRLRAHNPFRLDHQPAAVRYNPWEPVVPPAPPPPAPVRPPLALAGLLGGPPWNALIEGIPGRESGVLLQLGDSANGVRFVALRGDTVVLAAFDTTWSLTARRAWR
jgi:hypothetical protein